MYVKQTSSKEASKWTPTFEEVRNKAKLMGCYQKVMGDDWDELPQLVAGRLDSPNVLK